MTNLIFFGSDQYSQTVLARLSQDPSLQITHSHDLPSTIHHLPPNTIGLSASFPYLFPPEIIQQFDGRLYNLHPSLLPQYRNVAPVPYAIAMGDSVTGITLQRIDEKIDHGEIIAQVEEPIHHDDTTPILTHRLFALGSDLFLEFLGSDLKGSAQPRIYNHRGRSDPHGTLIFTKRLTSQSGFVEWSVLERLIANKPIKPTDTHNPLIQLRLTHKPCAILYDLVRALEGYEKVWTIAPTRKGDLRLSLALPQLPTTSYQLLVLIAGKPKPISWSDFTKYYVNV